MLAEGLDVSLEQYNNQPKRGQRTSRESQYRAEGAVVALNEDKDSERVLGDLGLVPRERVFEFARLLGEHVGHHWLHRRRAHIVRYNAMCEISQKLLVENKLTEISGSGKLDGPFDEATQGALDGDGAVVNVRQLLVIREIVVEVRSDHFQPSKRI